MLGLGSGTRDSGSWGWWFCASCNGDTEPWEIEHLGWQNAVLEGFRHYGSPLVPIELRDHDPGAFVRALWAWMFALDDALFSDHRDLAAAIKSGEAIELPHTRPWLTEAARNEPRRAVSLLLPTVGVQRRPDYTVRYEDIVVRQLQI